jgi:hypothetical protein
MHPAVEALTRSLSYGMVVGESGEISRNPVGRLAQVYEVARNALEYRADHLVRRAAIERILKRQVVFEKDTDKLADSLVEELEWARYVNEEKEEEGTKKDISLILEKYLEIMARGKVNREWLMGVASAEIEEKLNPNTDYQRFTSFAFHVIRRKISMPEVNNIDLLLYIAVDKIFSQSDDQQIAYHILRLIKNQSGKKDNEQLLIEAAKCKKMFADSPISNTISVFVRRNMAPMVLLRDMYFSNPGVFTQTLQNEEKFKVTAAEVLIKQLRLMRGKLNTASWRSLLYVFLTKMIVALLIEVPAEKLFEGSLQWSALAINLVFPVFLMWAMTAKLKLPNAGQREKLVERAWITVSDFEVKVDNRETLTYPKQASVIKRSMYYGFYAALFMAIFYVVIKGLLQFGFNVISLTIFVFFLCVISFFAYRIRQLAQIYYFRPGVRKWSSLGDVIWLPIVVVGSWLSKEVSKLNFLVFIFDFVLEAPFKIILRFLDRWSEFLSSRRDEAVG